MRCARQSRNAILIFAAYLSAAALVLCACPKPRAVASRAPSADTARTVYAIASSIDRGELRAKRGWRIAFVPKFKYLTETGHLSSYWQPAWEGAESAGRELGISVALSVAPASGDSDSAYVEPQIALVSRLIGSKGLDGLIIGPFDSGRLAPVVEMAIAAGIPTIAIDTPVSAGKVGSFVGIDNYAAGKAIGGWVARRIGSGKRALVLSGPRDARNAIDRRDGTIEALQEGGVKVLGSESGEWEVAVAREIVEKWIRAYPSFDAIVASNDNMAIGSAAALKAAGRRGVVVTGFDATADGLDALRDGRLAATVDQAPAAQGRLAVRLMTRLLQGEGPLPAAVAPDEIRVIEAGAL